MKPLTIGQVARRSGVGVETVRFYERQGLLFIPEGLPDPADREHVAAVIETAAPLIEVTGGGAFVLFTSHRALQAGAQRLRERWGEAAGFRLLVQGEAPREQVA